MIHATTSGVMRGRWPIQTILYGCTGQSRRGDPLPWHRKLPRRRPSPFFTHNQVEQYGDFHSPRECSDFRTALWIVSASARLADVPPQITDCVDVARTVRECVRVWESGEHGRSGGRSSDRGQHGAKYQAGFPVGGQRQLDPPLQYWQAQAHPVVAPEQSAPASGLDTETQLMNSHKRMMVGNLMVLTMLVSVSALAGSGDKTQVQGMSFRDGLRVEPVAMEWRLCVGCLIFRCRADHHRGETMVM